MVTKVDVFIEPVLVSYEDAGKMLGIGRTKAWQLARDGKLKTVKVGADNKIVVASIRSFVAELVGNVAKSS
jgi:hypothetical protein